MVNSGLEVSQAGYAMSVTTGDLNDFHRFAEAMLSERQAESLHELVDIWEVERVSPENRAADVAAVRSALRDMENGDVGRPAQIVINELRKEIADQLIG
jgi:hypothetical protein